MDHRNDVPRMPLLSGPGDHPRVVPATVLRAAPCLFRLYSVVAALYHALPEPMRAARVDWPGKAGVTFSDARTAVRRWLWADGVFPHAGEIPALATVPPAIRDLLPESLTQAA